MAQCEVGKCYEEGWGVAKDLELAKKWYLKAAACGNKYAKDALQRLNT